MKNKIKSIITILMLGIGFNAFAQQSGALYHVFTYEGKSGITDTQGNETVPPIYNSYVEKAGKYWILETDSAVLLFDPATGKQETVEEYRGYHLSRGSDSYALVKKDGTYYLRNQYDDTEYRLPKDRTDISSMGDYFYIEEEKYIYDKPKDKNTLPKPPIEVPVIKLYKQPDDEKPALEVTDAKGCKALWDIRYIGDTPKYYAFYNDRSITVYSNSLKMLKKINEGVLFPGDLSDKVSKALNEIVDTHGAPPTVGMDGVGTKYPRLEPEENNGKDALILATNAQNKKTLFVTDYKIHIRYYNTVHLYKDDKLQYLFDVELSTGHIFYPTELLKKMNVEWREK